ncbi:Peroxisomal membrane protein pex16 [Gonapodya sp. JEL0774]|nr:Peroxisomal membrane protein pex16 [Gonapodya sp. JEL0774]
MQMCSNPDLASFRSLYAFSALYARLAIASLIVTYVEQFVEMTVTRKLGQESRWRVVALIEVIKTALRLAMLSISNRMSISGRPFPDRDVDLSSNKVNEEISMREPPRIGYLDGISAATGGAGGGAQEGNRDRSGSGFLDTKVRTLSGVRLVGEVGWIVRPAIYTLLINNLSPDSPLPLAVSFLIDVSSFLLSYTPVVLSNGPTHLEREEYTRRVALFAWYVLREPVYSTYVKGPMLKALGWAMRKPPLHLFFCEFILCTRGLQNDV